MRCLLALVFLLCSLKDVAALQKANAQDYRDIADQISKKKAAEKGIVKENMALDDARGDEAEELRIKTEIARLKKVQKNAAEQAIWLTMRAFDIIQFEGNEPILPKGYSFLDSPEKRNGIKITWLPIFEDNGRKEMQDAEGNPAKFRIVDNKIAGNTASDGISRIFPSAFDNPVQLASYIIHEKRHFTQNTTDGEGNKKTTAELEVEAYEEEQRLLIDDVLGYPEEIAIDQEKRLIALLFGEKGKKGQKDIKGKRELAREERAAADQFRGGVPPPEVSQLSHSPVDIDGLIQQAKDQIVIAQRDHDDRLRNTIKRLTQRSCANPGSVSQAELLALPRPHRAHYWMSNGPGHCHEVYAYMAQGGTDAEDLRRMSTPLVPINPNPHIPAVPAPVQGFPVPPAMFATVLPDLKDFAIAACHAPEQVALEEYLYRPYDHSAGSRDGNAANLLATDLSVCPKQLFKQLIATIRDGQGATIDRQWIRSKVAAYTPGTGTSPGYVDPSPAPPSRGRRCEDFGVINCPKNLLQVKL